MIDYSQGRRFGTSTGQTGAFGFNTGFGSTNATSGTTGGAFGATNTGTTGGGLFGSAANTTTTPAFGANTGGFGQTNTSTGGGLFGAPKPATTGGLFGSNTGGTTSGGLFGSNTNANTTSAFGTNTGTTGAFGSTGATGGGLFGSNSNQPKPGGFSFGSTATTTPATGAFGSTGTGFGTNTGTTGGGLFGGSNQQQQQQQQPATSAFGATSNTTTPFGGFGTNTQQQQQQQPNTGGAFGSAFGANTQQQKPAFGTGFGSTPAATSGGLFGNNQQQPQQQQQSGGLFGSKPGFGATGTAGTTGSLFGGTTQTQQPQQQTGGLFGGNTGTSGGGLFGSSTTAQNTGTGLGGFGQSTAKPSLFGTGTTTQPQSSGLFGSGLNNQQPALGGSLFGGNQQQPQQQQQGTGLFSGSTLLGASQQQPQQNFSTSINDSPYAGSQLLGGNVGQNLGPIATPLGASTTKKAAMIPHHKIAPKAPTFNPRGSGVFSRSSSPFGSSSIGSTPLSGGALGRSFSTSNKLNLFDDNDQLLNTGAFTPGGSSRVASLKKLVIDKKLRDENLFSQQSDLKHKQPEHSRSGSFTKGILKKTVSFDMTGRDESLSPGSTTPSRGEPSAEQLGYIRSPAERRHRNDIDLSSSIVSAHQESVSSATGKELALVPDEDKVHGSYWMVPTANKLRSLPKEQQKKVIGLTVGRRGYGQVRFDNPVDITNLPVDIEDLPGNVVVFDVRVCTVYPEGMDKPAPGKGLNVPATITLEDCFPVTKNERGKIRDPAHPRYMAHIRRLKSVKDTEFVDYLPDAGTWIFRVEHFTTYGLVDSDDEEVDPDVTYEQDEDATPRQPFDDDSSLFNESMDADISGMDTTGEDTFDFKRLPASRNRTPRGVDPFPGSFTTEEGDEDAPYTDDEIVSGDVTLEDQSFLGEGSVGSVEEEEEPAEPSDESEMDDDTGLVIRDEEESGLFSPEEDSMQSDDQPTPRAIRDTPKASVIANNWTEQLNNTISPVKRRFGGDNMFRPTASISRNASRRSMAEKEDYNIFDLQNDLYGTSSVGPGAVSPTKSRKRDAVEV